MVVIRFCVIQTNHSLYFTIQAELCNTLLKFINIFHQKSIEIIFYDVYYTRNFKSNSRSTWGGGLQYGIAPPFSYGKMKINPGFSDQLRQLVRIRNNDLHILTLLLYSQKDFAYTAFFEEIGESNRYKQPWISHLNMIEM